jgi:outer membrane protein assembly factor BamB
LARGSGRRARRPRLRPAYAFASRDKFYALDVATGREKWSLPAGRMVLMERPTDALVLTTQRDLLVTDKATGTVALVVPMTGLNLFVANTDTPAIFAGSRSGLLCCIRSATAGRLTPEMLHVVTSDATKPATETPAAQE